MTSITHLDTSELFNKATAESKGLSFKFRFNSLLSLFLCCLIPSPVPTTLGTFPLTRLHPTFHARKFKSQHPIFGMCSTEQCLTALTCAQSYRAISVLSRKIQTSIPCGNSVRKPRTTSCAALLPSQHSWRMNSWGCRHLMLPHHFLLLHLTLTEIFQPPCPGSPLPLATISYPKTPTAGAKLPAPAMRNLQIFHDIM